MDNAEYALFLSDGDPVYKICPNGIDILADLLLQQCNVVPPV